MSKINIGDTWKDINDFKINIGDSWKTVEKASINIGDSWKEFYTAGPSKDIPNDNTLGMWEWNSSTADATGNGFTATIGSSNTYSTAVNSNGLVMAQGADSSYRAKTYPTPVFTSGTNGQPIISSPGITMGTWFKQTGEASNEGIMNFGSTNTAGGFGVYIPGGTNDIYLLYGGLAIYDCDYTITDTNWHHIMLTMDDFATSGIFIVRVYIDGTLKLTHSTNNPRKPNETSYGLQWGCMANNTTVYNQQFIGMIDDSFIDVGDVWTASEILEYYNYYKP